MSRLVKAVDDVRLSAYRQGFYEAKARIGRLLLGGPHQEASLIFYDMKPDDDPFSSSKANHNRDSE